LGRGSKAHAVVVNKNSRARDTHVWLVWLYHDVIKFDGQINRIRRLRINDDVDRPHVKIDNLNDTLVEFFFIRSIDGTQQAGKFSVFDM
jgi:hypothetical protein